MWKRAKSLDRLFTLTWRQVKPRCATPFGNGRDGAGLPDARAFAAFGGVPRRGIYDNMKTAVDKVGRGKERTVNARFQAMCGHYLFEPEFCNRAAGWEKGIVEKNVQDRRRQLWAGATARHWPSLHELNAWLASECRAAWAEMHHPDCPELTLASVLDDEQPHLMPEPQAL
jgi:hypothetical protein